MKVVFALAFGFALSFSTPLAAEGKFAIVGTNLAGWIWVLNTETGEVKTCLTQGEHKAPVCSAWSQGQQFK